MRTKSKQPLQRKPLTKTTSLNASSSVRAGSKRSLKSPKPRLTLEQKSASQLIGPADGYFSKYIRLRDSVYVPESNSWVGNCITCDRKLVVRKDGKYLVGAQNGHFITRGCHSLRYSELNCSLQCSHCNAWRDKESMLEAYRKALDLKYGTNTVTELKQLSEAENAYKRLTKPELLAIINDCKTYLTHCEEHSDYYAK